MNPPALEKSNYNTQNVISNDNLLEQLKNLPSPSNSEPHPDNFLDTKYVENNTYLPQGNNSTLQNESNLIHFQKDQAPSSFGSVAPTEVKPEVKNLLEPEHQNPSHSNIPNSYTIYPPSKETEKIVQPPNYNYSAQPAPSYGANPPSFGISNGGENNQTNGFSEQRNNYGENNQEKIKNILSQYQTSNTSTNSMNNVSTSNTPVTKSQSWNPNQTFNANPFVAPNSPVVQHPNANQVPVSNTQVSSQVEKIQQIEQNPYGYNQQKVLNPPPQYHPYPQSQPQSTTAQQVATFNNAQYTQTKEMLLQMQGYFEKIMKFMESVDQRLNNLESATKEILKNQQNHSTSTPSVTQSPTLTTGTSYPSSTTSYPTTSSTPTYPTSTPSYPTTTSTPSYSSSSSPSYPTTTSTPSYPTTSYPSTNYSSTNASYPSLNSTSYPSVSNSVTSSASPEIPINKYELEAAKKAQEQLDKDAELAKKLQSEIDTESKKSDKPKVTMQECPVCSKSISSKELESHVEQCLAKFESTKKPDEKTGTTPANTPGFFSKLFGKNDKNNTTATDNKTPTNTTATSPPKTNPTNPPPPAKPAQAPAPGPQPVPTNGMYYPGQPFPVQPQQGQNFPPYVMYPPNPSMVYRGNTGNTNIPNQQQGPYGPQMYPVQYVPVQPNMQGMQGQQPMYYYPPGTQFPQPNQQPQKK